VPSHSDAQPGRTAVVQGFAISNALRSVGPGEWGIRLGTQYYPDYATPHPTRWDGEHGGHYLDPDEADELAKHLQRAAAWARAQQRLEETSRAA
jgi:hypothetical protein